VNSKAGILPAAQQYNIKSYERVLQLSPCVRTKVLAGV
jgi:hypothetical protein